MSNSNPAYLCKHKMGRVYLCRFLNFFKPVIANVQVNYVKIVYTCFTFLEIKCERILLIILER